MTSIIHVRGTSGSGKSHLARRVMARYDSHADIYRPGRKRPFATIHSRLHAQPLYVPGHYETACGGADTIATYDDYFDAALDAWANGKDVLLEGLLSTPEVTRTLRLHQAAGPDLHIIFLDTPLGICLDSVNGRRAERAERGGREPPPPLNPKNTISKHSQARRASERLADAGVQVQWLDREAAYARCCEILGLEP